MPADPKPVARIKDPARLRQIHKAYQMMGCSFCGRRSSETAPPGTQVEVHHIQKRSQGGSDSWENTIGLCGEMAGCRMHYFVEQCGYRVSRADGTLWLTTPGGTMQRLVQLHG